MPSGVITITKVNKHVELNVKRMYGRDNTGNWRKIDKRLFLYPIPIGFQVPQVFYTDLLYDNPSANREINNSTDKLLKKFKLLDIAGPNEEELNDLKKWLKMKLAEQNFSTSAIKIGSYVETVSIEKGVVEEQRIIYERLVILD